MWNKKTQEQKNLESLAKYESLIVYYTELKKNLVLEMGLTHEEKPKESSKVDELENNAMTLNYGKSKTGRYDWFFMGYTFPDSFKMSGAKVSNTRLFIQKSANMTEQELISKWSNKVLKKLPKGFKLGGQRY